MRNSRSFSIRDGTIGKVDKMFLEIFAVYVQGLMLSIVTVFIVGSLWMVWRAVRKLDKTVKARQAILYETLMIAVMTAPILSFAYMAILLMMKS